MGKVVYLMNVSLDGFVNTADGSLDWTLVDEELHSWFNEHEREAGAFVYGRRLYEAMAAYAPTPENDPAATPAMVEFARIWNPKPKVCSRPPSNRSIGTAGSFAATSALSSSA